MDTLVVILNRGQESTVRRNPRNLNAKELFMVLGRKLGFAPNDYMRKFLVGEKIYRLEGLCLDGTEVLCVGSSGYAERCFSVAAVKEGFEDLAYVTREFAPEKMRMRPRYVTYGYCSEDPASMGQIQDAIDEYYRFC